MKMWQKLVKFLKEVRQEMKKVSWPNRDSLIGSTKAVIAIVVLAGLYIALVDTAIQQLLRAGSALLGG